MIFQHGIHILDALTVPTGETYEAAAGARVIITRSNGQCPVIENHGTLKNIWIGGTFTDAGVYAFDDSIYDGVTLFGYKQAINSGSHNRAQVINSRFVKCGDGDFYHPIYVSNPHTVGNGMTIADNLFVNCDGYSGHFWNDSLGGTHYNAFERNFINGLWGLAGRGNYNTFRDNIFWDVEQHALYLDTCESLVCNHNLFRACIPALLVNANGTIKNNAKCGGTLTPFGTGFDTYTKSELKQQKNIDVDTVNLACAALAVSFGQSVTALLNDATIEGNFTVLRNAVSAWTP